MTTTSKSHPDAGSPPDLETIVSDLASLRRDLATLMEHVKAGTIGGANGLARDAADRLSNEGRRLYDNLSAQGERSVKAIGRQVEEQPVMSLLLAFALGFIGSRWLSR